MTDAPHAVTPFTIPPALRHPAPRPVKRTGGPAAALAQTIIFSLFLAVLAGIWIYTGLRLGVYFRGQEVSATVVDWSAFSSHGTTISFTYQINGRRYNGQEQMTMERHLGRPSGTVVTIKRLNILGKEMVAVVSEGSHWGTDTLAALIGAVVFSCVVGGTYYLYVILPRAQRRLIARGVATEGRIVSKRRVQGNTSNIGWIVFQYRLHGGTWLEAEMRVRNAFYARVEVDQPVVVFYDPKDAEEAVIHGAGEYEVDETMIPAGPHTA